MDSLGVFVTGVDTGVGKTVVAAALAGAMRGQGIDIGVMKPVETGVSPDGPLSDAEYLQKLGAPEYPLELICPVRLAHPLAPSVAARLENIEISVDAIMMAFRTLRSEHDMLIVEGAGGLAVPIKDGYLMSDLAVEMGFPIVVVCRPVLGAINHCILTVSYARSCGLKVAGIIIANWPQNPGLAESTNPREIELYSGTPILGFVDHDSKLDIAAGEPGATVDGVLQSGLADRVLAVIRALHAH